MATSQWKLTRIEVAEKSITLQEVAAKTQIPLLDRLPQSQCRLERSYARAQRELERLQKSRRPVEPPEDDDDSDKSRPRYVIWGDPDDPSDNEIYGPDGQIDNDLVPQEAHPREGDPQDG